jgi:hypothetical protein
MTVWLTMNSEPLSRRLLTEIAYRRYYPNASLESSRKTENEVTSGKVGNEAEENLTRDLRNKRC